MVTIPTVRISPLSFLAVFGTMIVAAPGSGTFLPFRQARKTNTNLQPSFNIPFTSSRSSSGGSRQHAPGGSRLLILLFPVATSRERGIRPTPGYLCCTQQMLHRVYLLYTCDLRHCRHFRILIINEIPISAGKSNGIIVSSDIIFYIILRLDVLIILPQSLNKHRR